MPMPNLKVFNDFVYTAFTETENQYIDLFNEASNNTMRLVSAKNRGDFSHEVLYAKIAGMVRRRNPRGNASVATLSIDQKDKVSVKIATGAGPVDISESMFDWIQVNPEEAATVVGQQLAFDSLKDKVDTGIGAVYAALVQNTAIITDATGFADNKCSLRNLALATRTFGDQSARISAWVMHSVPANDLLLNAIDNGNRLFKIETISIVQDASGRPIIVTDSPFLVTTAGAPAVSTYHVLGLQQDGLRIEDNGDFKFNVDERNGNENIEKTWQAEWSYNVNVLGYSWDTAAGGSPTTAALTTSANWVQYATSNKDVAGVILEVR